MSYKLTDSLQKLEGVGPKICERFKNLNIQTIYDLLAHFPVRYENRSIISPLNSRRFDCLLTMRGQVIEVSKQYNKKMTNVVVSDGIFTIDLYFYHLPLNFLKSLKGKFIEFYGKLAFFGKKIVMYHPQYQTIASLSHPTMQHYYSIYPLTLGISHEKIQKLIDQLIDKVSFQEFEFQSDLPSLKDAFYFIHRLPLDADLAKMTRYQSVFDQKIAIFSLLPSMIATKVGKKRYASTYSIESVHDKDFLNRIPFTLTNCQTQAIDTLSNELTQKNTIFHLLQGDVGSGKTVIGIWLSYLFAKDNLQSVWLAPTEILALQHYNILSQYLNPLGIEVVFLKSKQSAKVQKTILDKIATVPSLVIVRNTPNISKRCDL